MNNLAVILEQVIEARKLSNEQPVQEKLDELIKTILDLLKNDNRNNPPIPYTVTPPTTLFDDRGFESITRTPLGGYQILCMADDTEPIVVEGTAEETSVLQTKAREMANRILGRA